MAEILEHATCELQEAFKDLTHNNFRRFKAENWLISIKINPKIDTDLTATAGYSAKHSGAAGQILTWTLGTPGIQLNAKGNRSGGITYTIQSQKLLSATNLPCNRSGSNYHALTQHLGVGEWLRRSVSAMSRTEMAELDSPTYTSQITIKFGANGGYSYVFPKGSDTAGLGASYTSEQQLVITMTEIKKPKTFRIISLPDGENFPIPGKALATTTEESAVQDAKNRAEILQLEQAIRSLRTLE